ncbi:4-hydroxybenzoate octaprenyltransferase [Halothiobacillus diazotrophicus]|uniref:4-hydroxybenzoate octaprenyltransferase n=1 Tax=Halothiobacillus diazotrophicus TaxID=1860122 RepID=UPI001E5D757D|nr:4-hydroxybenzoate octaprenyltransferase [Halothiobacillus diazotrophicus]
MSAILAAWQQKLSAYLALTRLNRPIGIFLLLWPTYWALWVAGKGAPSLFLMGIFTLGVIVMRSAGCAINDYADRHVDGHVARTQNRPLATGALRPREAIAAFFVLLLVALVLVLQLNRMTIALSLVAVVLAATYPLGKRFHHLPQVQLGLAFGWSIPMAFAAQAGSLPPEAWLLFAANMAWTVAYDTLYAIADRPYDEQIGVKSTAILFGRYDLLAVGFLYVLTLGLLAALGIWLNLGLAYAGGLVLAALAAIWILAGARSRTLNDSVQAFKRNNVFGALVMIALVLGYAFDSGGH